MFDVVVSQKVLQKRELHLLSRVFLDEKGAFFVP